MAARPELLANQAGSVVGAARAPTRTGTRQGPGQATWPVAVHQKCRVMGFAGILANTAPALATVRQSWPDLDGQYTLETCGLHLQWWGTSSTFFPPVWNARRDVMILRQGELFEEEEQDLLERYVDRGLSSIEQLNGRFLGLVVDLRDSSVHLFNDRFGLSPCFWHQRSEGFFFASSARALRARLKSPPSWDLKSLAETVSMGCTLDHRTLFQGIERLPPSTLWTRQGWGPLHRRQYFCASEWRHQDRLGPSVFHRQMGQMLAQRIPAYLKGPAPIGMSLTGGLDGRLVMAWSGAAPQTLACYSFSGPYRECTDAVLGRQVALACGQSHQTMTLQPTWLASFPRLAAQAAVASDGLMDASGAVELFINRWALQVAPVRLTGNWGSEILRFHVALRPRKIHLRALQPDIADGVLEAQARYLEARQEDVLSFIAFKQLPWHHSVRLSLEESVLNVRSPFLDNDIVRMMYRAPADYGKQATQATLNWVQQARPALARIPTDRGVSLGGSAFQNAWRQWQQTLWIKAEYAMDYGMPSQWAAGLQGLGAWHPERWALGRHKFYHFRSWYQGALSNELRAVLLDPKAISRSIYQRRALERMVSDHTAGRANHTLDLHRAWSWEMVHQHLLGDPSLHLTEELP